MKTNARASRWTQPQLFHQKGWIANNFQVKNNVSAMLKLRKRNMTEQNKDDFNFKQGDRLGVQPNKPATAPEGKRIHRGLGQKLQQFGLVSGLCEQVQVLAGSETRYSNFKTSVGNRKPLLFIRPYMRYQDNSRTIDQRKSEIYRQINNPDLSNYDCKLGKIAAIIQYMTEYKEPYTAQSHRTERIRPKSTHQKNMNLLAQKLKRYCIPSLYQKRMTALKDE